MRAMSDIRMTQYAHGGGCACKIPPGELEAAVAGLIGPEVTGGPAQMLVGLDDGDDAAVVKLANGTVLIATTDFFTPVVDDPYDWGRIAAANALSDVYAMGGTPVVALNLVGWPRDVLPLELLTEVLRGGLDVTRQARCHLAGGHSIDDPEPKYGLAVTGVGDPGTLMRIDSGRPGTPLSLTKPLGIGVLNTRHKATGERFAQAIDAMTTLNRDAAAVRYLDGAREAVRDGYVSGGTRRNLDWVAPHTRWGSGTGENERLLLADAQTSGGLLIAGELPGGVVIGELIPDAGTALIVG